MSWWQPWVHLSFHWFSIHVHYSKNSTLFGLENNQSTFFFFLSSTPAANVKPQSSNAFRGSSKCLTWPAWDQPGIRPQWPRVHQWILNVNAFTFWVPQPLLMCRWIVPLFDPSFDMSHEDRIAWRKALVVAGAPVKLDCKCLHFLSALTFADVSLNSPFVGQGPKYVL